MKKVWMSLVLMGLVLSLAACADRTTPEVQTTPPSAEPRPLTQEEIDFVRDDVDDITKEAKQYIKLPSMIKTDGGKFKSYQLGSTYYSALRRKRPPPARIPRSISRTIPTRKIMTASSTNTDCSRSSKNTATISAIRSA